jgi:hypothetical protein
MDLKEKASELVKQEEIKKQGLALQEEINKKEIVIQKNNDNFDEINLKNLQNEYLKKQVEKGNSLAEISMDYAKANITNEIFEDDSDETDKYKKELAKERKDTIKESFKQDKISQQTKTIDEKQRRAEAFYKSVRPILEFDFSNLINKKHKKEDGDIESKPKTYEDRSYGIPLMCLMLLLLTIPYCIVTIVLAIFNGINAIFEAIATFSKTARIIALSIFIIALGVLVVYCALLGIDALFGTHIINTIIPLS